MVETGHVNYPSGLSRLRRSASDDDGFSLVESIVAITVAAMIFSALAAVMISALRTSVVARQVQQSIDLTTQAVETVRALDYSAVGLDSTDGAADSAAISGGKYTVKLSDGTSSAENVVYVSNSTLNPHKKSVTVDNTVYTVSQYVTTPPADSAVASAAYKRLTVDVSWKTGNKTRHRISSTLVSLIRRGLPQPKYTWGFSGATNTAQPAGLSVNRGALLQVSVTLTNRGARDRWNVTTVTKDTANTVRPWVFAWYNDNGAGSNACDGVKESDENTRMDPNSDGVADTNTVDTDKVVCLVGNYTVPVTEAPTSMPASVAVTATSNAVNTISSTVTTKVTVLAQTCPSCTYTNYYLTNTPAGSATASTAGLPLSKTVPVAVTLPAFSTDVDASAGRFLTRGGLSTDTDPRKVGNWFYSSAAACTFKAATAYVQLYGLPNDLNPDDAGGFAVELRYEGATAGTYTSWGTGAASVSNWGYSTYAGIVVPVTLPALSLAANKKIEVRVWAPSTGTTDMRLAYHTATYSSTVVLPVSGTC